MPSRSHEVAVVAHCHLNANTKVRGLATCPGVRADVLLPLIEQGVGVVQLPCPEATYLGMNRWGMSVEQYDNPAYRRHCREIIAPVIDLLVALAADGCAIRGVVGVDGSPSCGVTQTCTGYAGGEIEQILDGIVSAQHATCGPGRGIFMQELDAALRAAGIGDVPLIGLNEAC